MRLVPVNPTGAPPVGVLFTRTLPPEPPFGTFHMVFDVPSASAVFYDFQDDHLGDFRVSVKKVEALCHLHPVQGGINEIWAYYTHEHEALTEGSPHLKIRVAADDAELDGDFIPHLNGLLEKSGAPFRLLDEAASADAAREAFFAQPPRDPSVPLTPLQRRMQSGDA